MEINNRKAKMKSPRFYKTLEQPEISPGKLLISAGITTALLCAAVPALTYASNTGGNTEVDISYTQINELEDLFGDGAAVHQVHIGLCGPGDHFPAGGPEPPLVGGGFGVIELAAQGGEGYFHRFFASL